MESKSQQYINEMEKNAKLFEEKLNKFKSYQTSEAYSQQDEYEEKENEKEDFQINKKKIKTRSLRENQEQSEKSEEEEYYSRPSKNREKNPVYSSKKIYKKENSGKYNYKPKAQKDYNYNDNEEDYDEYEHKQKMKTFNNFKHRDTTKSKEQANEELIEEMRANLIEKSNLIKKLNKDLKDKEKLPSKIEFDRLNSNHEKVSNELEEKIKYIKQQDDEIEDLRNKLDNLVDHNKNLKNIIKKKNDELDGLKITLDEYKDEIRNSVNKYNEISNKHKQLVQDYDNLNKDYINLKNENHDLNSVIEEQKAELFNHKKEIIELKKHINKLNSERHVANGANEIYNNDDVKEKEYENDDYPKKGKQLNKKKEPYETNYEYEEYEEFKGKKNQNSIWVIFEEEESLDSISGGDMISTEDNDKSKVDDENPKPIIEPIKTVNEYQMDEKSIMREFQNAFDEMNDDFIFIEPKLIPIIPGDDPAVISKISQFNEDYF